MECRWSTLQYSEESVWSCLARASEVDTQVCKQQHEIIESTSAHSRSSFSIASLGTSPTRLRKRRSAQTRTHHNTKRARPPTNDHNSPPSKSTNDKEHTHDHHPPRHERSTTATPHNVRAARLQFTRGVRGNQGMRRLGRSTSRLWGRSKPQQRKTTSLRCRVLVSTLFQLTTFQGDTPESSLTASRPSCHQR
jgi:hypothetical protein